MLTSNWIGYPGPHHQRPLSFFHSFGAIIRNVITSHSIHLVAYIEPCSSSKLVLYSIT